MKKVDISKTKLKKVNGDPEDFFHTSKREGGVTRYYPLSHFGTLRAANQRAVHFILQRLGVKEGEVLPDHVPDRYILQLGDNIPPLSMQKVNLYMKNPKEIRDLGRHDMHQYWAWFVQDYVPKSRFLSTREWQELTGIGHKHMAYKQLLTEFIFIDPFTHTKEELMKELDSERLFDSKEWNIDTTKKVYPAFLRPVLPQAKQVPFALAEHVALQRMIRFLEGEGYDGFKYDNYFEDKGKPSYIIFRPEQVFNPLIQEKIHDAPVISPEEKEFLQKQEHAFFAKRGVQSPSERIEAKKHASKSVSRPKSMPPQYSGVNR